MYVRKLLFWLPNAFEDTATCDREKPPEYLFCSTNDGYSKSKKLEMTGG